MKKPTFIRMLIPILALAMTLPLFACNISKDDPNNESDTVPKMTETETEKTTETETKSDTELPSQTDTDTEAPTDSSYQTESYAETESITETEILTETVTETKSETETLTETVTETETETETVTETESVTETETEYVCKHEYEFRCSDKCSLCGEARKPGSHTYSGYSTCKTLTCKDCGFTLEQDHNWEISSQNTATLLSAGDIAYRCSKCFEKKSESTDTPIDPATLNMPIVYITDLDGAAIPLVDLKKEQGEIVVKYKYVSNDDEISDFDCYSKIKIQGASSSGYVKKNFTIKLYTDDTLEDKNKVNLGWGNQNKYCMKANYIDFSQARNIVAAQMFSQVVASRDYIAKGLENAPNYGLIDGYPVLVYINGSFHGLYTMNIPKDAWQFAMKGEEEAREALLMADAWTKSVRLSEEIGEFSTEAGAETSWEDYGWEVEHCSTADEMWIRDSFNALIRLLNCGDNAKIRAELPNHLDIEAAIDNFIFTCFINAYDNRSKNILWATYDGQVWIPSMYDMDGTFGVYWNGQPLGTSKEDGLPQNTHTINPETELSHNKMWAVLVECYPQEVEARYAELRGGILNMDNTRASFERFFAKIDEIAYISDIERWNYEGNPHRIPYTYEKQHRTYMYSRTEEQLRVMDAFFYKLVP